MMAAAVISLTIRLFTEIFSNNNLPQKNPMSVWATADSVPARPSGSIGLFL